MPKPMKLVVEVEESHFGRVFRTLDNMAGVATLTIVSEGVKGPKPTGNDKRKKGGTATVPCIILGELMRDQVRDRAWLDAAVKSAGRSPTSVPDALAKLRKAKEIKQTGPGAEGVFSITAKGKKRYETACAIQPPAEG